MAETNRRERSREGGFTRSDTSGDLVGWSPESQKAKVYDQILLDIILCDLAPGDGWTSWDWPGDTARAWRACETRSVASRWRASWCGARAPAPP